MFYQQKAMPIPFETTRIGATDLQGVFCLMLIFLSVLEGRKTS